MTDLVKDLRHAVRALARRPALTALAVLSLGLGIGVNSSIYSLVHAVLDRGLPMARPSEVVDVYTSDSDGFVYATSSYPDYRDIRDQADAFSELAAFELTVATWDDGERTQLLFGQLVSGNYFDLLGTRPALGRAFLPEEDATAGTHPVVILGHRFHQQRFAGDPAIVGRTVELNGIAFSVIGVAPEALKSTFPVIVADFWAPMTMADRLGDVGGGGGLENRGSRSLFLQGRLRLGVDLAAAQAQLGVVAERLGTAYPETNEGRSLTAVPASTVSLNPGIDGPLRGVAGLLMVLVGLVLLIACSNIANLLLARAADRRREIAVRLALGSSRGRLMRLLLFESLLLGLGGAALGLLLARWTVRLIVGFQPPLPIPLSLDVGFDSQVLLFTAALGILTGLVCGLAPAFQASRPDLVPALKNDAGALGRRFRRFGLRNVLVVSQVAISTLLLVGSALFLRSLGHALAVDPGFTLRRGVEAQLALSLGGRYDETTGKLFYGELLERARTLPAVRSAALASHLPLGLTTQSRRFFVEGAAPSAEGEEREIDMIAVSPGYFATLGIPLLSGRDFGAPESAPGSPGAVIVNETTARRFWPGEDPVGKRLRFDETAPWSTVVAVARDGKYRTLGEEPRPFLYTAFDQDYSPMMTLVVASDEAEGASLARVRSLLDTMDPQLPIFDLRTLSSHLDIMLFPARLGAALLLAFGLLGTVLASVGLYGVVSYAVSKRTREVGIRMAIGAGRDDVLRLVVGEGMGLVGIGLALGVGLALVASRAVAGLLFDVSTHDPAAYLGVVATLVAVALVANVVPARKAMGIEPFRALRDE